MKTTFISPVLPRFSVHTFKWTAVSFRLCRGKKCFNVKPLSGPRCSRCLHDQINQRQILFLQKQTWAVQISGLLAEPHSSFLLPFQLTLPAILHSDISTSFSAQPFLRLTFVIYSCFCFPTSSALHLFFLYTLPDCFCLSNIYFDFNFFVSPSLFFLNINGFGYLRERERDPLNDWMFQFVVKPTVCGPLLCRLQEPLA